MHEPLTIKTSDASARNALREKVLNDCIENDSIWSPDFDSFRT